MIEASLQTGHSSVCCNFSNLTGTHEPGGTTTNTAAWMVFTLSTFLVVLIDLIIIVVVIDLKKNNREDKTAHNEWKEAANLIREALQHVKSSDHPTAKISFFAYQIVHSTAYRVYYLVVTVALLLLALFEFPTVFSDEHTYSTAFSEEDIYSTYQRDWLRLVAAFEFVILLLLLFDLTLTIIWLQPQKFFTNILNIVESVLLLLMFIEVIVVMARNDYHPRLLRVVRPFFFINSHLMYDLRRVIKEIFQVFKTILDVALLLMFLVVIFSIFGFYLLARSNPDYFSTFGRSFVSMFVLLTTANFPDVMLESYHVLPYSPIFFIIYLVITLYIGNMKLAVLYSSFADKAKKKSKKLLQQKRNALHDAYNLLKADDGGVSFQHFILFMEEYQPERVEWEVLCIYKALQKADALPTDDPTSNSLETPLTRDQFFKLYQVTNLSWRNGRTESKMTWNRCPSWLHKVMSWIEGLVKWPWFDSVISVIVIINIICEIVFAAQIGADDWESHSSQEFSARELATSFAFTGIFCIEILLRIIGLGLINYFKSVWNICDFLVLLITVIAQFLELHPAFHYATFVRSLKLLRLLRLKKRYRDTVETISLLMKQTVSVTLLVVAMCYFFAIIGMEAFRYQVYPHCCENGSYFIGALYSGSANSTLPNVYWLNNFNNILRSYVTLFELMVVNNWFVIMEGFASEAIEQARPWVRLYFIVFYICVLVLSTLILSFMIEAFTSQLELWNEKAKKKRFCRKKHKEHKDCKCYRGKSGIWYREVVKISRTEAAALDKQVNEARNKRNGTPGRLTKMTKTVIKYRKKFYKVTPELESDKDFYTYTGSGHRTQDDSVNNYGPKHPTEEDSNFQRTSITTPEPTPWREKLEEKLMKLIEFVFE